MKRICLYAVGIFLFCFRAWAQDPSATDDYKSMKLKVEDVNIVSDILGSDLKRERKWYA